MKKIILGFCLMMNFLLGGNVFAQSAEWADVTFEVINEPPAAEPIAAAPAETATNNEEAQTSTGTGPPAGGSSSPTREGPAPATGSSVESKTEKSGYLMPRDRRIPLTADNYDEVMVNNKVLNILNPIIKGGKDSEDALHPIFNNNGGLLPLANKILAAVAILWIIILGIKFIFAQGEEEKITKYKTQIGWLILGLAVISIAEFAAYSIFNTEEFDILRGGQTISGFSAKANQIKVFMQILVMGVATITGVLAGYNLITAATDDETIANEKRFMAAFLFAVGFIFLSEAFTDIVSHKAGASGSAAQGVSEMVGILNFALTFLGGAAVFMLVLASLYYVISFGKEDQANRAKSIIIACVVGIVIIVSSYVIVTFFIR